MITQPAAHLGVGVNICSKWGFELSTCPFYDFQGYYIPDRLTPALIEVFMNKQLNILNSYITLVATLPLFTRTPEKLLD